MARTSTTYDVFSAIGEPKRRALIEQLVLQQMTVGELADAMQWSQPMVSKHLKVLKDVSLVAETKIGRFHYYRIQPEEFRPIQDWIHQFEKYWGGTFDQLENYINDIKSGDRSEQ